MFLFACGGLNGASTDLDDGIDTVVETPSSSGGLLVEADINFEIMQNALSDYYEDLEDGLCEINSDGSTSESIHNWLLFIDNLADGILEVPIIYTNNSNDTAFYIAGAELYGGDGSTDPWAMYEENLALNSIPGTVTYPSQNWESTPRPVDEYWSLTLLPGESATQLVRMYITCRVASGEWLPMEVGDVYEGGFLSTHGTCTESPEDIPDGESCTPSEVPETTTLPTTLTVVK